MTERVQNNLLPTSYSFGGHKVYQAILDVTVTAPVIIPNIRFVIDTGASITILNARFNEVLRDAEHTGVGVIQYGAGSKRELKMYKLEIMIKGNKFLITALHDPQLSNKDSLLGMVGFVQEVENLSIFGKSKKLIIIP